MIGIVLASADAGFPHTPALGHQHPRLPPDQSRLSETTCIAPHAVPGAIADQVTEVLKAVPAMQARGFRELPFLSSLWTQIDDDAEAVGVNQRKAPALFAAGEHCFAVWTVITARLRAGLNNIAECVKLDRLNKLDRFLADVQGRAYRIAQIATNSSDDALDLVQDAMFKLVEKYADRDEQEWGPLFHSILQSRINDWHRRGKVRRRVMGWLLRSEEDEEDPIERVADEGQRSPEQHVQMGVSMEKLQEALQALPLRQQQVFLLRVWEGLDVRQTAQAMACAEGSVKSHYSRAVHSLRQQLGDHW